jgi:hypothetical protein
MAASMMTGLGQPLVKPLVPMKAEDCAITTSWSRP